MKPLLSFRSRTKPCRIMLNSMPIQGQNQGAELNSAKFSGISSQSGATVELSCEESR